MKKRPAFERNMIKCVYPKSIKVTEIGQLERHFLIWDLEIIDEKYNPGTLSTEIQNIPLHQKYIYIGLSWESGTYNIIDQDE